MVIWYHRRYRTMHPLQKVIKEALHKQGQRPRTTGEDIFALHAHARLRIQPVPEHQFHPKRKWKFDFAWPLLKIAVEIEGGVWRGRGRGSKTGDNPGGAHSHPMNILRDIEKYNAAGMLGWRVFRFTTDQVKKGEAIDFMEKIIHA